MIAAYETTEQEHFAAGDADARGLVEKNPRGFA